MSNLNAGQEKLASSIVQTALESGLSHEEMMKAIAHALVTGSSAVGLNDFTYEVAGSGKVTVEL